MSKKKKQHRNAANPELHQAMHELRRSSAAQPHADRRERRARTKGAMLRRELKNFVYVLDRV
jgi:hypothetical protein